MHTHTYIYIFIILLFIFFKQLNDASVFQVHELAAAGHACTHHGKLTIGRCTYFKSELYLSQVIEYMPFSFSFRWACYWSSWFMYILIISYFTAASKQLLRKFLILSVYRFKAWAGLSKWFSAEFETYLLVITYVPNN